MFRDVATQYHSEQRTIQAFMSLLALVEALTEIMDQTALPGTEGVPLLTLEDAGQAFAEITNRVLNCKYVGVFALDLPGELQRLLGVDGLPASEIQRLRKDTAGVPLANYLDDAALVQFRANQILTLDLKVRPFVTERSTHHARYRLVAPLMVHGQFIGFFTVAKNDDLYPDVQSAYTPAEIAMARGLARLAAQVFEKVRLLQEKAEAQAKQQKLQEATRRYEDSLSIASHELRTPLTSIKGNVQLAQRRVRSLAKQIDPSVLPIDTLQRIEEPLKETLLNFNRLERMISELLDFSRIQAARFVMVKQPCNLVEIARRAVAEAQQNTHQRTFLLSLPEAEKVPIYADADRITEVINNYLSNAHKYSSAGLPIHISLTVEGPRACVAVRDEGPGIPPADQARIWERFYRAPDIKTQEQGCSHANLGLGLYLCKEIVDLHQGQIGVTSTPGQGTTFWFTLDLAR